MLTDQHRLKVTITVSWGRYLKIACVTVDGLFSVPVTLIRFIGFLMFEVAEMILSQPLRQCR